MTMSSDGSIEYITFVVILAWLISYKIIIRNDVMEGKNGPSDKRSNTCGFYV